MFALCSHLVKACKDSNKNLTLTTFSCKMYEIHTLKRNGMFMIKRVSVLALLLTVLLPAAMLRAQGRHEINVYSGGYEAEFSKSGNTSGIGLFDSLTLEESREGDLYDLYEPHYAFRSGPVLSINYHYILNNVVRVGAQMGYGTLEGKYWYRLGNLPERSVKQNMLSILPQAKFCIPGMRHFRLYGKVALGLRFNFGPERISAPVTFAWDVVPIGAEWGGQRIYGTAELCYGSIVRGGRIGIGFRF